MLGLGLFGIAGAVAGGLVAMGVSDDFFLGVAGSAVGAVVGVMLRGAAQEIRSRGPGLAV